MGPNASYGIIVEGPYDTGVFVVLIRRITENPDVQVEYREADNDGRVISRAAVLLHSLKYVTPTGPVDKALVIRDTDLKRPDVVETRIQEKIKGHTYPFPNGISIHAVVRETETWLLADPAAIAKVAERAAGRKLAPPAVPRNPEKIPDAKETLIEILERIGLLYTPKTCAEIAAEVELAKLKAVCPSFGVFEQKVLDP